MRGRTANTSRTPVTAVSCVARSTGEFRGFGFVYFRHTNATDAAVAMSNGAFPNSDRPLHVTYSLSEWTRPRTGDRDEGLARGSDKARHIAADSMSCTVCVKGLGDDITHEDLAAAFPNGVESVHWSRKRAISPADAMAKALALAQRAPAAGAITGARLNVSGLNAGAQCDKTALKAALRAARPPKYFTGTVYIRLASADAAADAVAAQVWVCRCVGVDGGQTRHGRMRRNPGWRV